MIPAYTLTWMVPFLRHLVARGLVLTGIVRAYSYFTRHHLRILMLHAVAETSALPAEMDICMPPNSFAELMTLLAKRYHVVSLDEAVSRKGCLPPYSVVLTFDDGYRHLLATALPHLRMHASPATVFIISDLMESDVQPWPNRLFQALARCDRQTVTVSISGEMTTFALGTRRERDAAAMALNAAAFSSCSSEREAIIGAIERVADSTVVPDTELSLLSWDECRTLVDEHLVSFGSHSSSHEVLAQLSAADQQSDAAGSRARLASELGRAPTAFAYPFGTDRAYTVQTMRAVQDAGFTVALSGEPGFADLDREPYSVKRLGVGGRGGSATLALHVSGLNVALRQMTTRARKHMATPSLIVRRRYDVYRRNLADFAEPADIAAPADFAQPCHPPGTTWSLAEGRDWYDYADLCPWDAVGARERAWKGDLLVVGRVCDELVAFGWLRLGSIDLRADIPLPPVTVDDAAHIYRCFVVPKHRTHGLLGVMLDHLCQHAGRLGSVAVYTHIEATDAVARRDLSHAGFQLVGRADYTRIGLIRRRQMTIDEGVGPEVADFERVAK